jgi:hypothetical protein
MEGYRKTVADCPVVAQLFNTHFFTISRTRSVALRPALTAMLMAPLSRMGLAVGTLLSRDSDFFLDSVGFGERLQ